jgi:hypothetical protein
MLQHTAQELLTENKILMKPDDSHSWQTINKFPFMNHTVSHETVPSSGQQVNFVPSFQTLLAVRRADSFAKFECFSYPAIQ